jgi:hypothetical protein
VQYIGFGKEHDDWHPGKEMEDTEALDIWEAENGTDI